MTLTTISRRSNSLFHSCPISNMGFSWGSTVAVTWRIDPWLVTNNCMLTNCIRNWPFHLQNTELSKMSTKWTQEVFLKSQNLTESKIKLVTTLNLWNNCRKSKVQRLYMRMINLPELFCVQPKAKRTAKKLWQLYSNQDQAANFASSSEIHREQELHDSLLLICPLLKEASTSATMNMVPNKLILWACITSVTTHQRRERNNLTQIAFTSSVVMPNSLTNRYLTKTQ